MTNLIAKVAELRELEAKATPGRWYLVGNRDIQLLSDYTIADDFCINFDDSDRNDPEMIVELRNAAQKLLDVLGKIHAGDSDALETCMQIVESMPKEERKMWPKRFAAAIEVLHRYADLARLMEGNL